MAISERRVDVTPAIREGVFSRSAVVVPPGYQWTMTKSIELAAMESTVLFQSALSPGAFSVSGQPPGVVSTAPIFTVGSTAFIAFA